MKRTVLALALALAVLVGAAVADDAIRLRNRTLTPAPLTDVPGTIAKLAGRHALVQLHDAPNADERARLHEDGVRLLSPVGPRTFTAFIADGARLSVASEKNIRHAGAIETVDKIHALLAKGVVREVENGHDDGKRVFAIETHLDVSEDAGRAAIEGAGLAVLESIAPTRTFMARGLPSAAKALANADEILFIAEGLPPLGPNLDVAKPMVGGDVANEAPYSVTGDGVNVFVLDGGTILPFPHDDLMDRQVVNGIPFPDLTGHAHNVSCIVGGNGFRSDGLYEGIAPEAFIVSSFVLPLSIPPLYNSPGNMNIAYKNAIQEHGATVSNNSIGANLARLGSRFCDMEGDYEATARLIDTLVREEHGRISIVWSVGNERGYGACGTNFNTVAPPATAKNSIAVGALDKEDLDMTSFSSWGPTDDGRLRPDVSAPGCDKDFSGINACFLFNQYVGYCGTSQAGPVVAGGVALVQEYWRREVGGEDPWASTTKALVIHGAKSLTDGDGPTFRAGYGALDIPPTLDLMTQAIVVEDELDQSGTYTIDLVADGGPAKATLVWTDPPATTFAAVTLINDLDLAIREGDSKTHLPWILDPANPNADATRGANHRDPVEQVEIANLEAGTALKLYVTGTTVPEGPQRFSLVVSGLTEGSPSDDDDADDDDTGDDDATDDDDAPDDDQAADDDDDDDDDDDGGCCGC